MSHSDRRAFNEAFLRRYLARHPELRERGEALLRRPRRERAAQPEGAFSAMALDSAPAAEQPVVPAPVEDLLGRPELPRDMVLETIVNEERPVLFVRDGGFDFDEVTVLGPDAEVLVRKLKAAQAKIQPLLPLIGRIDVENFPSNFSFIGSGWFVTPEIIVTNRHVAKLIAEWDKGRFVFSPGMHGKQISASFNTAHESEDTDADPQRVFEIKEVLFIERFKSPNDIAFIRAKRKMTDEPRFIPIAPADVAADVPVCTIGYPARAPHSVIPDQAEMERLYRGRYDVKRAAPGFSMPIEKGLCLHDCTTLGGASGSVLLDLAGQAVGLHFAGLYHTENYAVRASVLSRYIRNAEWNRAFDPVSIQTENPLGVSGQLSSPAIPPIHDPTSSTSPHIVTFPLTISVSLGSPAVSGGGFTASLNPSRSTASSLADVESAVAAFLGSRPEGVIAARVGFLDEGDSIGDHPCIAASVPPDRLDEIEARAPQEFNGVLVRYFPADPGEQIETLLQVESVDSIAYDDNARVGEIFSFDPVNEEMEATLHVGPEYSWEVLQGFLQEAKGRIVSSIYEFHATHIKNAIEERLKAGASLSLVLDNASFGAVKHGDFDRVTAFAGWANRFGPEGFRRIVAPEGIRGLISDSYHIKVTVREDDTLWLSSGNWKNGSSQPIVTDEQRARAAAGEADIDGNREWHVVIKNKTLATRFRAHIQQDFKRSQELGGREVPAKRLEETFIDVPLEETVVVLERRAPNRVLAPRTLRQCIKVRPLMTPDAEGAVYASAVLKLIRSAKRKLLFQIPYIGMSPDPRKSRGFIDDLIEALTEKLVTLDDARVLLRSASQKYSSPTHVAWYFKSKGVDIDTRLRVIDNHHTKGMIVDDQRVLLGSHNWSKPGVSLNRDASLLFDDRDVAAYYTDAFQVDWERSREVKPKRFVKTEGAILEAVGAVPPQGYRRVSLSDFLKEE